LGGRPKKDVFADSSETLDEKQALEEFKKPERRILLTTLKKANAGLNLQDANYAFILNLWWNPFVLIQAMARIIRKGQKNPVFCFLLGYAQPEQTMDKQFHLIYEDTQFLSIMNELHRR